MFSELFPIVLTRDMARALGFYRDLLGGAVEFEYPGPDGAPVYVGLDIRGAHLGIGLDTRVNDCEQPRPIALWLYTESCDRAVERLSAAGVPVAEPPQDQPWGERVARVRDPDGNEIIIGERADAGT